MDDNLSKNIIIVLLIGLVIGLLGVIFVSNQDQDVLNVEDVSTEENSEEEIGSASDDGDQGENKIIDKVETAAPEKTALPVPTTTELPETNVPDIEPYQGVVIVTYTDTGFIPPVVEVTAGDSVTFINSSTKPLWVTSENHPTAKAQVYPGFGQGKSVSTGGTYTFSFTQIGVWGYKNLNQDKHLGAISVIAQ